MRFTALLVLATALCAAAFISAARDGAGQAVGPGEHRVFAPGVAQNGPGAPGTGPAVLATYTLDALRAVSAAVDPAGGTLSVTGADGTKFTLTVPAGALLEPRIITMTPLASLSGIPEGTLVAGVDIQPGGLELTKWATLDIVPAAGAQPTPDELALTIATSGAQVLLAMVDLDVTRTRLYLDHFSAWTIANVRDRERALIFQQKVDEAIQLTVRLRRTLAQHRQKQLARGETPSSAEDAFEAQVTDAYERAVVPALDTAELLAQEGASAEVVAPGIEAVLGWLRTADLFLADDYLKSERLDAGSRLEAIIVKVAGNALARCKAEPTPRYVREFYEMARQVALWGADDYLETLDWESCKGYSWAGTIVSRQVVSGTRAGAITTTFTATVVFAPSIEFGSTLETQPGSRADYTFVADEVLGDGAHCVGSLTGSFPIGNDFQNDAEGYGLLSIREREPHEWVYRLGTTFQGGFVQVARTCMFTGGTHTDIGYAIALGDWMGGVGPCAPPYYDEFVFQPVLGIHGVRQHQYDSGACSLEWHLTPK